MLDEYHAARQLQLWLPPRSYWLSDVIILININIRANKKGRSGQLIEWFQDARAQRR
jgi:hypothetical protein